MTVLNRAYAEIAVQTVAYNSIMNAIKRDMESHAYMLEGEDTVLSLAVAIAAVCFDANNNREDFSSVIAGRLLKNQCGDLIILGREGFKAEDANTVLSESMKTPSELKKKYFVLIMDNANETSQNKLLKTLEEAPNDCIYYLIVRSDKDVLPTVVSRTEVVRTHLNRPFIGQLSGQNEPYYAYAAYAGGNSLTSYDELISGNAVPQLTAALDIIAAITEGRELVASSLLPNNRTQAGLVLKYMEKIFADIMTAQSGEEIDTNGLYDMEHYKAIFSLKVLPKVLKAIGRAVERLPNGNMSVISDMLAISLAEALR